MVWALRAQQMEPWSLILMTLKPQRFLGKIENSASFSCTVNTPPWLRYLCRGLMLKFLSKIPMKSNTWRENISQFQCSHKGKLMDLTSRFALLSKSCMWAFPFPQVACWNFSYIQQFWQYLGLGLVKVWEFIFYCRLDRGWTWQTCTRCLRWGFCLLPELVDEI